MPKYLAVDLDGTLFYPKSFKNCICKRNLKFLRKWIDQGNKVILVTSRSHDFTSRLEKIIGRPVDTINCTSTQIYADGELIHNEKMDNQAIKEILSGIIKDYQPLAILLTTKDFPIIIQNVRTNRFMEFIYYLYWIFQFGYREKFSLNQKDCETELNQGDIYKIMIFFGLGKNKNKISKEINHHLREDYPTIESSWVSIVNELTPPNCNKGEGLSYYCSHLHIDSKDVYVVGDSGNDISMFKKFYENSYCMAHSYPSVKKYAKHVITRVYKLDKIVLKGETNEQH